MFNLNVFDTVSAANKGAVLHLRLPVTNELAYADEEKTKPVTITLQGTDSDAYSKIIEFNANKRNKETALKAREKARAGKFNHIDDEAELINLEEQQQAACEMYAKLTTGFENISLDGKKPLECTVENARNLYMSHKGIRTQVDAFIADQANFIVD